MTTATLVNGVDTQALGDTIEAVRQNRALGEVTFSMNGQVGGFRLDAETGALTQAGEQDAARAGQFRLSSDEPAALLGSDTAVSPGEYLLQALAGCYTVTLAANAAGMGIELESYRLHLEIDFDLAGFLGIDPDQAPGAVQIRARIDLDAPGASREQLENLVRLVEARSPIRSTLTRGVEVVTELA
ncbi:OsmC family protein [Ruicaihuangia caeni]|uniref:OsmC family protein n=1 Tax=Ruicaihuangia caeni TaxID=3042517 RepID=UPI00338DEA8F